MNAHASWNAQQAQAQTNQLPRVTPRPLTVIEDELRARLDVVEKELERLAPLEHERDVITAMLAVKV